jgi:hypothetical protein
MVEENLLSRLFPTTCTLSESSYRRIGWNAMKSSCTINVVVIDDEGRQTAQYGNVAVTLPITVSQGCLEGNREILRMS